MTTDAFINLLDDRGLIPAKVTRQLRAKAAAGDERITPQSILKYLVKKELLSRDHAKDLLHTTIEVSDKAESSILGLAPLPEFKTPATTPREVPREDVFEPPAKAKPLPPPNMDDLFAPPTSASSVEEIIPLDPVDELGKSAPAAGPGSRLRSPPKKGKNAGLSKKPKTAKSLGKNEFDTPLILLGGAGLATLVVVSVILWFLVFRESADALLKQANDAFERGQYAAAEDLYESFVEKNSSHQHWSHAKVRLATSPMWEAAENRDFSGAAKMAPEVVGQIEDEPAFISYGDDKEGMSTAKRELSTLLTMVAVGLAEQAEAATSDDVVKERIAALNQMLELTSNAKYVPQKLRNDGQLNNVRETLKRVEMREQRESTLASSLASMDEAIKRGEPAAALATRAKLLTDYPMLENDETLQAKVLEISAAEKSSIRFTAEVRKAVSEPLASPVVAELALADRRGDGSGVPGAVALQLDGVLYGLSVGDGSLLWRRYLGHGAGTLPLMLSDGKAVAVDAQRGELNCIDVQSGRSLWRLPLEGQLATPSLAGERLLISSDAGRLYVVDAASGELAGHVDFSQPLRTPPITSENGQLIYVLGEHSNLYTLSTKDFTCASVHYLGHQASEIVTPPVIALDKIVMAQNSGAESSHLRVLALDDRGLPSKEVAAPRLNGLVLTNLQTAGRRLAAVTSFGQVAVFELGAGSDKGVFNLLASRDAQGSEQIAHFAALHEGHLWVAGRQLLKLAIMPTGNQLGVQSLDRDFQGDSFDYPFQAAGGSLISVRRRSDQPGLIVAAVNGGGGAVWETELAVPPAGPPVVDDAGTRIVAGSATGALFTLDRDAMARRVQNVAARSRPEPTDRSVFADSLRLPQGNVLLAAVGGAELLHYQPDGPQQAVRVIKLLSPLGCAPVLWRDGFVTATHAGQVSYHNAADGASLAAPFQPELPPGREHSWVQPVAAEVGGESQLVVSDGTEKIHALTLKQDPQPHLAAIASANVGGSRLITPLAVLGDQVFAGNEAGRVARFALPQLEQQAPIDVGGRIAWGPHATQEGLLAATDANELLLFASDGTIKWRQPLKHGLPSGKPLLENDILFVLFSKAGIARIDLAKGDELAMADLGQPAVSGPVAFGPRLLVSAADGTLLVVNRP